jgi:hypothetical protein
METILANLSSAKTRRTTINGREYLVAPLSLIVPGVLNGSKGALYYPPEEISRDPGAWNGMPLVVYHPSRNGEHVSGRDPEILESQGVGYVYRAAVNSDGKLAGEGWFDVEAVKKVDQSMAERKSAKGDPAYDAILPRLEAGLPIELSTGLFTENEPAEAGANYNGKPYSFIARNYRPDHLAILPDQKGACSNDDGCGVLVNEEEEETVGVLNAFCATGPGGGKDPSCPSGGAGEGKGTSGERFPSKFNKEITYGNKSDRDSDDKYFAGKVAKAHKEVVKAKKDLDDAKQALADHEKRAEAVLKKVQDHFDEQMKSVDAEAKQKLKAIEEKYAAKRKARDEKHAARKAAGQANLAKLLGNKGAEKSECKCGSPECKKCKEKRAPSGAYNLAWLVKNCGGEGSGVPGLCPSVGGSGAAVSAKQAVRETKNEDKVLSKASKDAAKATKLAEEKSAGASDRLSHEGAADAHRRAARSHQSARDTFAGRNRKASQAHGNAAEAHKAAASKHLDVAVTMNMGVLTVNQLLVATNACAAAQAGGMPVTDHDRELGAVAERQAKAGNNPPSWAEDESIWERAKMAAEKYQDDPSTFYAVTTHIYQNMGGATGGEGSRTQNLLLTVNQLLSAANAGINQPHSKATGKYKRINAGTGKGAVHEAAQLGTMLFTESDRMQGQEAMRLEGPPSWVKDKVKWDKATAAAKNAGMEGEQYWTATAHIYRKLAGTEISAAVPGSAALLEQAANVGWLLRNCGGPGSGVFGPCPVSGGSGRGDVGSKISDALKGGRMTLSQLAKVTEVKAGKGKNPLGSDLNKTLVRLRDEGKIKVIEPRSGFGEPSFELA